MVIARKLLTPMLMILTLVLVAVIAVASFSAYRSLTAENDRSLVWLRQGFDAEIERMSNLSLALAKQAAANPEVQAAFILGDRDRLMTLNLAAFEKLQTQFNLIENQFTVAPATVILNLSKPEKVGRDLAKNRAILLSANQDGRSVSGLEMTEYGLAMHGVAPIRGQPAGGEAIHGSVDYSLGVDINMLQKLRREYGGEWQLLLSQPALTAAGAGTTLVQAAGPRPDLPVQATTFAKPIFTADESYLRALEGQTVSELVRSGDSVYSFLTLPVRDFSGKIVGVVNIAWDTTAALTLLTRRVLFGGLAGAAGLLIVAWILNRLIRRTLQPVQALTVSAQAIAAGNLRQPLPLLRPETRRDDEVVRLNRSFHAMTGQLRRLVGDLEGLVSERTSVLERRTNQLQAAADIGREVTVLSNPDNLLNQAVDLIRSRFDFYHAGVFLVDDEGEYAVLQAATGEAGRRMIASGYRLEVHSSAGIGRGMVGSVCGTGRPQIAGDVTKDLSYYKNPLLPNTLSEAVLPLRAGEQVIGALDVQSTVADAFSDDDITVLQIIADQLASAVNNSRLIATLNRTVSDLQSVHGQTTRSNWEQAGGYGRPIGYRFTSKESQFQPATGLEALNRRAAPAQAIQAIQTGASVDNEAGAFSIPIRLRDQVIGAVQVRYDPSEADPDLPSLIEEVSGRLGMMLESARLLEEAQRLAQREHQINVIATEMRSSVNLESILQSTVRELGKTLGVRRAFIQLGELEGNTPASESLPNEKIGHNGNGDAGTASGSKR